MNLLVQSKLHDIRALCEKHHVEKLFLFGSAATDAFREDSDLDFAVMIDASLDPVSHGESFLGLLSDLEHLFDRRIDLVSIRALKNPVFIQALNDTKVSLYEA